MSLLPLLFLHLLNAIAAPKAMIVLKHIASHPIRSHSLNDSDVLPQFRHGKWLLTDGAKKYIVA